VRFSVVIPTFGRRTLLEETLGTLYACEPPPDEILIVDGHPQKSAKEVAIRFAGGPDPPELRYLTSEPGSTKQRNIGIDAAIGDIVVFFDDDVIVEPNMFAVLGGTYGDPTIVGATGHIVEPASRRIGNKQSLVRRLLFSGGAEGSFTRFGYPRYLQNLDQPKDVELMPGAFMSARRDDAAAVRFDERLGGYALAEDEDFSYRLSRVGRIRYLPDVVIQHRKLGYSAQETREFGRLVVTNRTYIFRKNFPQTRLARLQFALLLAGLVVHRLLNREWCGARGLIEGAAAQIRTRA
jgi:GT2 family glycosyltransferase